MCRDKNRWDVAINRAIEAISIMGDVVDEVRAIYEYRDATPDLIGLFLVARGADERYVNRFEVHRDGSVRVIDYIPYYKGMGCKRAALLFSQVAYAKRVRW